jgi:hypothetical protein
VWVLPILVLIVVGLVALLVVPFLRGRKNRPGRSPVPGSD